MIADIWRVSTFQTYQVPSRPPPSSLFWKRHLCWWRLSNALSLYTSRPSLTLKAISDPPPEPTDSFNGLQVLISIIPPQSSSPATGRPAGESLSLMSPLTGGSRWRWEDISQTRTISAGPPPSPRLFLLYFSPCIPTAAPPVTSQWSF